MLKQVTDKWTLLSLLKDDKPVAFVGIDDNGGLYASDLNEAVNRMFESSNMVLLANFDRELDEDPGETEENEPPEPEPDEPEPEPDEPEGALAGFVPVNVESKRGPKPVDKGKVKALHDAGWTETEIADEFGATQPRIHKLIEKMKERGEL